MASTIVTRFAPSPTGYLHVGGARTALFSWLLARHDGGKFLLRIEDTDLARSSEDATRQLLSDLQWLGLQWDNEQIVFQSKRLDLYNKIIADLMGRGLAYEAWETGEELTAMRAVSEKAKRPFIYRKIEYSAEQLKKFKDEQRKSVIRFAMPVKEHRFHDQVLAKEIVHGPYESQDFVIRKTDGMPTYHFAVVVDDHEMGVTHVLRGLEHLQNTFNHIALQDALGYERPIYAHLSVMLNPETGEKLSKRDRDRKIRNRVQERVRSGKMTVEQIAAESGIALARVQEWIRIDTAQLDLSEQPKVMKIVNLAESDLPEIMVHDFRRNGYLPETLLNFLALQGWNPGGNRERMSLEEMVELFSLEGINAANPKFSRDKLLAFNTEACAAATPQRLLAGFKDYLSVNPQSPLNGADDAALNKMIQMKAGFRTFREVDEKARFMFVDDAGIEYDAKAVEKVLRKNGGLGITVLREIRAVLAELTEWTAEGIEPAIEKYCQDKQLQLGNVAQPIRVAISGTAVSPPIFQSLEFLGNQRTLARIDRCLAAVQTNP